MARVVVSVEDKDRLVIAYKRQSKDRQWYAVSSDLFQHFIVIGVAGQLADVRLARPDHAVKDGFLADWYMDLADAVVGGLAVTGSGDAELSQPADLVVL